MEERESSERKSFFIRTIIIIILLLLAFLSTILYVYLYPKTRVNLYDLNYDPIRSFEVKRYSTLESLPDAEKAGFTFKYWTYDDFELNGGQILDKTAELTTESVNLYANYVANQYRITYHVQYWDEVTEQYQYKTYTSQVCDYLTSITLPTGKDKFGELLPDFNNRPGYTFVGWTTKVMSEDDTELNQYLKYAGTEYDITIPSDIDFYAFFAKNKYTINLHTGIQYELDNGNPKKDENGEYIIKNISNDPNNDRDSVITDKVRFMDPLTITTDRYQKITLNEKNAGMAYDEYEFKGWYLDPDYTMPIAINQTLELKIQADGRPYYEYNLDGEKIIILAVDVAGDDGKNFYEFNIYSKWQRKVYEINLNKNSNSSNGKIEPIYLYKVFLDEQGIIMDEYGKYYNEGNFTYEGYKNGGHYCQVNLETIDVVDETFRNSNKNYRLVGWTDNNKNIDSADVQKYAWWQQDPWTEDLGVNRITGLVSYDNSIYIHSKSESVTLYAQWSRVYTVTFAYATGTNQKHFEIQGIEGEWFILPNMATIVELYGEEWTKKYNYFAGWVAGDPQNSLATKYIEKLEDGTNNPNYKYTISRANARLNAYWRGIPYAVTFYLNDNDSGTDGGSVFTTYAPVYGGTYKYFPSAPTRDGYIFDGWSKTDYQDSEYSTKKRQVKDGETIDAFDSVYTSSSNFLIDGNLNYYASWTKDFEIQYDANGGEFSGTAKTLYKYSDKVSSSQLGKDLKITLYVGNGISVSRDNYEFKGWNVKISDGVVSDKLIKTSATKKTTFDFYEIDGKYYFYDGKADGITIADSEKTEMALQSGKTVVLVANWEAKKYNVKIVDTLATEGQTTTSKTYQVAYDQSFTFPTELATGEKLDSKIGYKLVGFSATRDGEIVFAIGEDGSMPTIPANTITSGKTFYTVYEQKNISVQYKAIMPDDSVVNFESYNTTMPYGATLTLPVVSSYNFNGKELMFKYWYYLKDDVEVKIATGDIASYHNENDELIIYGHFEADSYQVSIALTNPYSDPNFTVQTFSIGNWEKNSTITTEIYNDIMSQVYEKLNAMLADYLLKDASDNIINGIYKGFKLDGLYTTGGYDDKFEVNKKFSSEDFRILGFTPTGMTLITKWTASNLTLTYMASEENGAQSKDDTSYNFASSIVLKGSDYLTLDGGKIIKSWYIYDGTTRDFFDCGATICDKNANSLQKYIVWDLSGNGTITLYANTEQTCTVEYYSFNGSTAKKISTQTFIWGESADLISGNEALVDFADKNMKFEGWYYNGTKVTSMPTLSEENNFSVKLYANLTFVKSIWLAKINGTSITEELISSETISVLRYNSNTNEYSYITGIVLDEVPELTADQIPSGYTYYGLKFGDNIYKIEDIESTDITLAVNGYDIKLVTYFTQTYTITYQVSDDITFDDDTTADKTDTYTVGYDGKVVGVSEIRIKYSAKKTAYVFLGWKILQDNGKLGTTLYRLNDLFTPSSLSTTLQPVFEEPTENTINAMIKFVKEDGSATYHEITMDGSNTITNGYTYTFKGENGVSSEWTSLTHDLYKWVSADDGNEYTVGDTFTIPLAIVEGQVFTFVGVWIEKYVVEFTQPTTHSSAIGYTSSITLWRGVEYKLTQTPYIEGADGVEFKYWIFDNNGTEIHIAVGDSIVLNRDNSTEYGSKGNVDGSTIHYLPKPAPDTNKYTLIGAWAVVTYNVELKVTDPDNSSNVYTLTLINVPFGTTIGSREMLNADYIYLKDGGTITSENSSTLTSILALENDSRGIIGWSTTMGSAEADADALSGINSHKTLYAVWQTKYELSFATSAEIEYEGGSIAKTKHLPNEQIDVNNVIKSIYAKGYTTIYYEDGKYYVANGSSNENYRVTGFNISVPVMVGGSSTTTLSLDASNKMPTFTFPASNVVLTPVIEKVYKVSFYDNTASDGGELVKSGENEKYFEFLRQGNTLNLSNYTHTRTNFTFLGWNTDLSSDSVIESVTANTENISVYAIWASNRKAMFQISMTSAGGNTQTTLLEFPLTKDNLINKTILSAYLNNELTSSTGAIKVYGVMDKMDTLSTLGHSAYTYNFKNYYLEGFVVSKDGNKVTFDLDNLCAENFGGTGYNTNENVVVTFNLFDIFKITYNASETDVEGTINAPDYFVAIDSTRVGKLVEKTTGNTLGIEAMILPEPTVTRLHYMATYWSTNLSNSSATKYSLSTEEQRTLTNEQLRAIATSLQSNFKQEYALYVVWEYIPINVYVYAIADVVDTTISGNEGKAETTLRDPYSAYLSANSDGSNIAFKNIPNLITINGIRRIVVGNYVYNGDGASIAQLSYNDTFVLNRSDLNYEVGGYRLVGFSTQLVKLGATLSEENYFALGEDITVTDEILTDGELKLYPYYVYVTKDVVVYVNNGGASVKSIFEITDDSGNLLTTATAGYVEIPNSMPIETESTIEQSAGAGTYSLNKHTRLVITANNPSSSYTFDSFATSENYSGLYTIDGTYPYVCHIDGHDLFTTPLKDYSGYYIRAIYSARKVKLTIRLDYGDNTLKDGLSDNGEMTFASVDSYTTAFEETLNSATTSKVVSVNGLSVISYTLNTSSQYYDYVLYSNGSVMTLQQGKLFAISDLTLSAEKDAEGYYTTEVVVKATPKTYRVTFMMNLGVLKTDTTMPATSDIYNGVTEFAVVGGEAIVYAGSLVTLPTSNDIVYAKNGRFLGFYLNGDTSKTYYTTYTINQDTTFVESFDDNAYSIQYVYDGKVKIVSGITPNSEYTIGIEEARNISGYTLEYWTFENGQKAFDDNETITITKSYILIAKYVGNDVTLRYTYTGTTGEKNVIIKNGQDITLLDSSTLTDTTHTDDKYIFGWSYNENEFKAGSTIAFADLGYTYNSEGENVIVLNAVYYSQYKYVINYETTGLASGDLTNASDFTTTTFYVRTTNASGDTYNENDLKVKVSDIEPLVSGESLYFDKYLVKYTIDGVTTEDTQEVLIGGILNLVTPKDNGGNMLPVSTIITYTLTPTFKSTNTQITIEYNLTNPSTNESVNTLSTVSGKTIEEILTGITFNAGATFTDDYMLAVSSVQGNATSHWTLPAKSINFDMTIEGLDWFKYVLKGYSIKLYIGAEHKETRSFIFGNETQENRNLSGYSKVELTPIWEQKYTLYYYNQAENLVKTEYFEYSSDLTSIALQTQDMVFGLDEELQVFDLTDYAWVGWTKNTANNHIIEDRESFVGFGKDLTLSSSEKDIHLYPAQSKIYTISFETIGIDDTDITSFVFNSLELPKIYLGISDDDTIDLSNAMLNDGSYFDFTNTTNLYSACNKDKYNFMLFSINADGSNPGEKVAFTLDNITADNMVVYAVWQKKAYSIGVTFEAIENSSARTNVLGEYSFSMPKFHGDKISLGFEYSLDTNVYTFAGSSNLKNVDGVTLEEKINAIIDEKNMDYLSISKMTYILGDNEIEIDWSQEFEITSPINIKIVFGTPIYRLAYVVWGGMNFDGEMVTENEKEVESHIISSGTTYSPIVDISKGQVSGYIFDYWTTSATNEDVKFFEGDSHTITADDLALDKLSSNYRLKLYPHYVTSYDFNFYYFKSLSDLQGYYQTIEDTTDETIIANARDTYYTKLSGTGIPETLEIGTPIGIYEKDSEGNYVVEDGAYKKIYIDAENKIQKTIFDDYLASNYITIILDSVNNITATISKFYDLYSVFSGYEYTTDGEVSVDGSICLALDLDGHGHSLYTARTYGNGTTNNVYLEYELIEHTVHIQSSVVEDTGSGYEFNKTLSEKYDVIAEFATNDTTLNDSGADDVEYANRRTIATSINNSHINTQYVNFENTIYLMNSGSFVRVGESETFIFKGWRVLEENTIDGVTTYTLKTLEEVASVTAVYSGDTINYWKISNIRQDLKIVAIYTERFIDVEINLTSQDNNGDSLRLNVRSMYGSETIDWSDKTEFITTDATSHTTTYKMSILYNSYMLIYTHTDLVESYQIGQVRIGSFTRSGNVTIPVNKDNTSDQTIDGKIVIYVEYEQVTYSLRIEANQLSNDNKYPATLNEIGYLLGSLEQSARTTKAVGTSYNYLVDIPVGATITSEQLGVPTINNFTFVKWQYLDKEDGAWKDITTSLQCRNLANINKEIYIKAVFTPNDVNIKYYVETETYDETSGETITIKKEITGLSEQATTAKYGSKLILPYVVIETDSYITTGWNLGKFGYEYTILSVNNEALDTLEIIAQTKPILYVVFDKGDTNYVIPADYPTTKADTNSLVSSPVTIPEDTDYYYNKLTDTSTLSVGDKQNSGTSEITLKSNTFAIPNVEIAIADSVPFEGWITKLNKVYYIGETYTYLGGEEGVDDMADTITLTAQASNFYSVKFVITDPTNKDDTYSLTTNTKVEPTISSIDLLINKDSSGKYITLNYSESTDEWLEFDSMNGNDIQSAYFASSAYKNDYKFYGWSTERVNAFSDIKTNVLDSGYCYDSSVSDASNFKYLPYYTIDNSNVCSALAYQQIAINLLDFIVKTGATTFYPIWETKYLVKFEKDDGTILQTAKYGRGEIVSAPNPNEYTLSSDDSSKWIGWKLDDNNKLEFVNNKASYLFGNYGISEEIWKPLWKTGYTLTLNMNFDRDAIANVFSHYGVTFDEIKNKLGYPYFEDTISVLVGSGNSVTIDDKTYYESYKYDSLLTEKDQINLLSFTPIDKYIYPTSLSLSNATWCDSYYTFDGWSKEDGTKLTDLQTLSIKENTTLYAIWTAKTFKVNFYQTKELAEAKGSSGLINLSSTSTATNPIVLNFADYFKVTDYEVKEYINNYPYLLDQDKLRFSKWNVVDPMKQATLNVQGGIPLINDLYLYPEYVDEYTVVFKTAQEDIIANQESNYQKVIDGEKVSIKNYIEKTLGQSLDLISEIKYLNNSGSWTIIDKADENIIFNSLAISEKDKTHKTFTIYLVVTAKVNLYAPSSMNNNFELISELEISLDNITTILSNNTYTSVYQLDLSVYNNVPALAGWYYYGSIDNNEVYKIDDIDKAIKNYKISVVGDKYGLVATYINDTKETCELDITNGLIVNLYAKLVVTETISLGTLESDNLIQKYAKLSVTDNEFVKVISSETIDKNIKSITISTIYNSPENVAFTIETEGYIVNEVVASDDGINYIAQNNAKTNEQSFAGNYNANISKSVLTSKIVGNETKEGMFVTYTFSLNSIIQNGGVFKFGITPFVFDVTYNVDSDMALMRAKQSVTSDTSEFNSTSIDMEANSYIYRILENGDKKAYELNIYSLTYTTLLNEKGYVKSVTFTNVPYGMSIYVKFLPQDDMYCHFDSLSFGYNGTSASSAKLIEVDITSPEKITYKPLELSSDNSTFLTSYSITANFERNKIRAVQLNLDYSTTHDYDLDNQSYEKDAWDNVLINNLNDNKYEKTISKTINTTTGKSTINLEYTWKWKTDDSQEILAGEDLSNYFDTWIADYHEEFDEKIDTNINDLGNYYNSLNMAQVLRYFWLDDTDSWHTYLTNKGNLVTTKNADGSVVNTIYSHHNDTVVLHINLDKAFLINAQSRTMDYTSGEEIAGVNRAKLSLSPSSTTTKDGITTINYYAYNSQNKSVDYTEGNATTGLLVKVPFNSKLVFTAIPDVATDTHVAYALKEWNVLNSGTIDSGVKVDIPNKQITIDSTASNSNTESMFAKFGKDNTIAMPEIYLRADVEPVTYDVTFNNSDDEHILDTLSIAYDKDIYNLDSIEYYYYAYTLNTLYSSEFHFMPKFKLACEDDYLGTKFVCIYDDIDANYGELQYIFTYWATSLNGTVYSVENLLTNKTNASGVYSYNDITLYACYEEAQELTFEKYSGKELTYTLYIAKVGNCDQFGVRYDTTFNTNANLWKWANENGKAVQEYYLAGKDNSNSIQVSSLADIENAYANNSSDLVATKDYIVYPRIDLDLEVYENTLGTNLSPINIYTYATLGGKIEFSANAGDNKLYISNIISAKDETISPKEYTNYTFGLWYLGDSEYITPDTTSETIVDANLYPHYNVKIMVGSSVLGTSEIKDNANNKYSVGEKLSLLSEPSFKNITEDANECRADIVLKYSETDKFNGYQYAVLQVWDNNNSKTLYTITFSVNKTNFNKIAFNIVTSNGNKSFTLCEPNDTLSIDDLNGYYTITPLAYPDNVTINLEDFAITNLDDTYQYSGNLSKNTTQLTIPGGSEFMLTEPVSLSVDDAWQIDFKDVLGNILEENFELTILDSFEINKLDENLTNFRWQYKYANDTTWNEFSDTMYALGDMSIRLVADWITYTATFEKMSNQNNLTNTNYNKNIWDLSAGINYSAYTISHNSITLFKGETLEYNKARAEFIVSSTINGRENITISIPDTDGYIQGWLQKTISGNSVDLVALTEDNTYLNAQDITFVAWVEQKQTINIIADKSISTYGYGDVSYAVYNPMGAGDIVTTKLEIDKTNKTYGLITAGASSKVTLTFAENSDVNHDLKAIKYSNSNGNSLSSISNSEISQTAYAKDIAGNVSVLFDASPTETQYCVASGENKILGTYKMYGGYSVEYSGIDTNVVTATIKDYWDKTYKTLDIYKKVNGTTSEDTYYPTDNCYIDTLEISSYDKIETDKNNVITNIQSGTEISNEDTTNYTGNKDIFVLKFNEYIHTVVLNFEVHIGGDVLYTLSEKTAYMWTSSGDFTGSSYEVNINQNNSDARMSYGSNSVDLTIGDFQATFNAGIDTTTNKSYKIESVDIDGNECSSDSSFEPEWTITSAEYSVKIYLEAITEVYVDFKLTLPNANDLANLYVSTSGNDLNGNGLTGFNDGARKTFKVGTTLSVSGNTLTIKDPNDNNTMTISYEGSPIYDISGWYLDTSDNHSNYDLVTRTQTINRVDFEEEQSYDLYSYDQSATALNGTSTTLNRDATIVLVADRKIIDLYFNTDYWNELNKSGLTSSSDEEKALLDAGDSGLHIQVLGGLETLIPDNSTDWYTIGNSKYLGRDNVPVPINWGEDFIECKGFSLGDATITPSNDYSKTGYAIIKNTEYFDVELTGATTWVFVEYPVIDSSIDVTFYSTESGGESVTLPFSANASVSLPTGIEMTSRTLTSYYALKNSSSRLYETIMDIQDAMGYSGLWTEIYCPKSITFDASSVYDDWTNAGSKCVLSGYTIVNNGRTEQHITELNLSSYSGEIEVYPEFSQIQQHTITIYGPFANTNSDGKYTTKVFDGEPFLWITSLSAIELSSDGYGTQKTYYTAKNGSSVVLALTCSQSSDSSLNPVLLEVSGNVLNQVSGGNGILTLSIDSVTGDYTFNAIMADVADVKVEYRPQCVDYTDDWLLSYDEIFYSDFPMLVTYYETLKNVIEGISPEYNDASAEETITQEGVYFYVSGYDEKPNGFIIYIQHEHCFEANDEVDYEFDGCKKYEYLHYNCQYCGEEKGTRGALIGYVHSWGADYLDGKDARYHYYSRECTKCGEVDKQYKSSLHTPSSTWYLDEDDAVHYQECTVCGQYLNYDSHDDYYEVISNTNGQFTYECTMCGYTMIEVCKHLRTKTYILWEDGTRYDPNKLDLSTMPCNETGQSIKVCNTCGTTIYLNQTCQGSKHDSQYTYYKQVTSGQVPKKNLPGQVIHDDGQSVNQHVLYCKRCQQEIGTKENCNSNTIRKQGTCSTPGEKECSVCQRYMGIYYGNHKFEVNSVELETTLKDKQKCTGYYAGTGKVYRYQCIYCDKCDSENTAILYEGQRKFQEAGAEGKHSDLGGEPGFVVVSGMYYPAKLIENKTNVEFYVLNQTYKLYTDFNGQVSGTYFEGTKMNTYYIYDLIVEGYEYYDYYDSHVSDWLYQGFVLSGLYESSNCLYCGEYIDNWFWGAWATK